MTRSPALSFVIVVALMLALAPAVLAKEPGVAAQLETAIPPDAKPGVRIDVAFSLTAVGDPPETPYNADPISLRVVDQRGVHVDVLAMRDAPGHYVATITVPPDGIGRISVTIPSEAPTEGVWELYVAPPVVRTAAAPATAPAAAPATAPATESFSWVIFAGALVALAAAAAAVWLVAGRRRGRVGASPTRI